LPADVYQIALAGQDDGFGHLHVVVIDIDADQLLCVPAYGSDGASVSQLTALLHARGIFEGTGWVEIDNRIEIQFVGSFSGKLAKWVPYKVRRLERRHLRKPVGQMSNNGLAKIVECLLNFHAHQPGSALADDELKKVKRLAAALGVRIPKGI
jgi:hypothetical protein